MKPREMFGRGFIILGGLVALGALLACPPPKPPVSPMPDADAALPAPPLPDCGVACGRYNAVCAGSMTICTQTCPGAQATDPGYTPCLAGATACMNCDATARAGQPQAGATKPYGR